MLLLMHWIGISLASGVVINEVVINPDGDDEEQEWIELHNASDEPIDLSGWTVQWGTSEFSDGETLDSVILSPGEYALVGSDSVGASLLARLNLGNASSNSDGIQLLDSYGAVVDTLIYGSPNTDGWIDDSGEVAVSLAPAGSSGQAIARAADGVDSDASGMDFVLADMPTPAAANLRPIEEPSDDTGFIVSDCPGGDGIKINELMVNPDGADSGGEWIELFNASASAVNLGDWEVEAGKSAGNFNTVFQFSSGVTMSPGEHLLLGDEAVPGADVVTGIDMGNAGSNSDAVRLVGCDGVVADTVVYGSPNEDGWVDDGGAVAESLAPKPSEGFALARIQDGFDTDQSATDFVEAEFPTPGAENPTFEPVECSGGFRDVKINEFMPDPDGSDADLEWVELYNSGDATVALDGWAIEWGKNGSYSGSKVFAVDTQIASGEIVLVGGAFVDDVDIFASFDMGNAGSNSDALRLVDCEGFVQDTVVYGSPNDEEWTDDSGDVASSMADGPGGGESLARVNDGVDTDRAAEDFVRTDEPTPGESNPETEPVVCVPGEYGVKINEILPNPEGEDAESEFIEIINTSDEPVSLAGWGFATGTSSWPATVSYAFPGSAAIPAGGFIVVGGLAVDESDFYTDEDNAFSLGNGSKNPDGVRLVDCTGVVQDTVLYGDPMDPVEDVELDDDAGVASVATMPSENLSLGRSPDGVDTDNNENDFRTNMPPSPGASNKAREVGGEDTVAKGCGCGSDGPADPEAPSPEASGLAGLVASFAMLIAMRRRD